MNKPVSKWIKVVTYSVGIPITVFIAYKVINFLEDYIDFVNPSPLERLQLLLLGLAFACLSYYALRRGLSSRSSECNNRHHHENSSYQEKEYSQSPRTTDQIYKSKVDNYKGNQGTENSKKYPPLK